MCQPFTSERWIRWESFFPLSHRPSVECLHKSTQVKKECKWHCDCLVVWILLKNDFPRESCQSCLPTREAEKTKASVCTRYRLWNHSSHCRLRNCTRLLSFCRLFIRNLKFKPLLTRFEGFFQKVLFYFTINRCGVVWIKEANCETKNTKMKETSCVVRIITAQSNRYEPLDKLPNKFHRGNDSQRSSADKSPLIIQF